MFRIASAAIAVAAGVNAIEAEWGMQRPAFSGFQAPQFQKQEIGFGGGYRSQDAGQSYSGYSRPSRPEFKMPERMTFERPARPDYGSSQFKMQRPAPVQRPDTGFSKFGRPSAPERPSYGFSSGFNSYGSKFDRPSYQRPDTSYARPNFSFNKAQSYNSYTEAIQAPQMPVAPQRPIGKGYYGYTGGYQVEPAHIPTPAPKPETKPMSLNYGGYDGIHKPSSYLPHQPSDLHFDDGYTDLNTGLDHLHSDSTLNEEKLKPMDDKDHHDHGLDHFGCAVKLPVSDSENAKDFEELINDYGNKKHVEIKESYAKCQLSDPAG